MKENDKLQPIDPALIDRILAADQAETWSIIVEHIEIYKRKAERNESFQTACIYGLKEGMEWVETLFNRNYEDGSESYKQAMITDLAFLGKPIALGYYARAGYLDSAASTKVRHSTEIIPEWHKESEAYNSAQPFDILEAEHVRLIAESIRRNPTDMDPDEQTTLIQLNALANHLTQNPLHRAAYIYHTGNYYHLEP